MVQNTKQTKSDSATIIATAALIAGNLIGAGILGLPINTGLAGLLPSMAAMAAGGAMMYLTAQPQRDLRLPVALRNLPGPVREVDRHCGEHDHSLRSADRLFHRR